MSDNLGSGISFDQDFDLIVGTTGDLANESGVDELKKDLAMQMVISLDRYIGQSPTGNLKEQVAGTAARVANADSRVRSVRKSETLVEFSDDREQISLKMQVVTEGADVPQELVFDV